MGPILYPLKSLIKTTTAPLSALLTPRTPPRIVTAPPVRTAAPRSKTEEREHSERERKFNSFSNGSTPHPTSPALRRRHLRRRHRPSPFRGKTNGPPPRHLEARGLPGPGGSLPARAHLHLPHLPLLPFPLSPLRVRGRPVPRGPRWRRPPPQALPRPPRRSPRRRRPRRRTGCGRARRGGACQAVGGGAGGVPPAAAFRLHERGAECSYGAWGGEGEGQGYSSRAHDEGLFGAFDAGV